MIPVVYYLAVGAGLFTLGLIGFLARRNLIVMFLCAELMLIKHLIMTHFGRNALLEHRERSAEPAAFVGAGKMDKLDALHLAQKIRQFREWLCAQTPTCSQYRDREAPGNCCAARPCEETPLKETRPL